MNKLPIYTDLFIDAVIFYISHIDILLSHKQLHAQPYSSNVLTIRGLEEQHTPSIKLLETKFRLPKTALKNTFKTIKTIVIQFAIQFHH